MRSQPKLNLKYGDDVQITIKGKVGTDFTVGEGHQTYMDRYEFDFETHDDSHGTIECKVIAPPAELGRFNPRTFYPYGTIVVNDGYHGRGTVAVLRGGLERYWVSAADGGNRISPEKIDKWDSPQIVYIPKPYPKKES